VLLYHLQRHSDHHAHPTRRYQALRDVAQAPVLPTGYAGMILLALVPPLWRTVMDPRVLAHYGGDPRLANLNPRTRARVLAAHSLPGTDASPAAPDALDRPPADRAPVVTAARAMQCPGCAYVYVPDVGDAREGFAPGTAWADVPQDWCCPDCGVRDKVDFVPLRA